LADIRQPAQWADIRRAIAISKNKSAARPRKAAKSAPAKSKIGAKSKVALKSKVVSKPKPGSHPKSAKTKKPPASGAKTARAKATDSRRLDLLKLVEQSLDADKAEDIVHIDLTDKSAIADFMVIATGRSGRQLVAMAQHLDEKLRKAGIKRVSIEGAIQGDWVLIDGGDIVVQLFRPETRKLYNLEKMWGIALPSADSLQAVG